MGEGSKANAPANRTLDPLRPLTGRWDMEIWWSEKTHKLVGGPASVRSSVSSTWIEDGCFLVRHVGATTLPRRAGSSALTKPPVVLRSCMPTAVVFHGFIR